MKNNYGFSVKNYVIVVLILLLVVLPNQIRAADGDLDSAFGIAGSAASGFPDVNDVATAVAVQPDGMIVAAGSTVSTSTIEFPYTTTSVTSSRFALVRYNRDGSLDASFGVSGKVLTD